MQAQVEASDATPSALGWPVIYKFTSLFQSRKLTVKGISLLLSSHLKKAQTAKNIQN
jgi:hypothetical protein